ncbi:MAG: exodeoxyribonuclease VII small subunit [Verrucomicrobiota bacterium]
MATKKTEISFEEAIDRLENLTESMENGDIPLADLLTKFEEGSKLLKACQSELKKAELKIEKLNLDTGETE